VATRERLLDDAVDYVAEHGVGELSLRPLAAALGTSHRMLIYHFGSKEGLLVEVVREVERRQKVLFAADHETGDREFAGQEAADPVEATRRMWHRLADPELWPNERLFFEMYGQALQGRKGTEALLDGIVDDWIVAGAEAAERFGLPPQEARAKARLGLAVVRGLLLDLLATGDRAGVDAAMEEFLKTLVT
jgi:AcrR family transcriptional regulator